MRHPRSKAGPEEPAGFYHCISRVVDRHFVFQERERELFRTYLAQCAAQCGVRVLTWCILSNHFHLLIEVPERPLHAPPLEDLIQRLEHLSGRGPGIVPLRQRVEQLTAAQDFLTLEKMRNRLWAQMYDLSQFMKLLKQRFSQWFNRIHNRRGTLWEGRFSSVWIEPNGPALAAAAASIDLNPVRVGVVEDPKDYRWCGHAEAVSTNNTAYLGQAHPGDEQVKDILTEWNWWSSSRSYCRVRDPKRWNYPHGHPPSQAAL